MGNVMTKNDLIKKISDTAYKENNWTYWRTGAIAELIQKEFVPRSVLEPIKIYYDNLIQRNVSGSLNAIARTLRLANEKPYHMHNEGEN